MKRITLLCLAILAVASVAVGAPDPWRVRVTDFNALSPFQIEDTRYVTGVTESWGTDGGTLRLYAENRTNGLATCRVATYTATTGAISFAVDTAYSVEGIGNTNLYAAPPGKLNHPTALKVGTVYKMWYWENLYTGRDTFYCASTDGVNFGVPTACTIYGSVNTGTGTYGMAGAYRSSAGVYLNLDHDSNDSGNGVCTSGEGETVWCDIDTTGLKQDGTPYGCPIQDRDTAVLSHQATGALARNCAGSLISGPSTTTDVGIGLVIANASELEGADGYAWVCDPDSNSTSRLPAMLGKMPLGLGGASLRTACKEDYIAGMEANQTDPVTEFLVIYTARWDTDSNGSTDARGWGRAKLLMTRNRADTNFDGTVDFLDVAPVSSGYGSSSGDPNYKEKGDLNSDGFIDESDVAILSNRYGSGCEYGTGS